MWRHRPGANHYLPTHPPDRGTINVQSQPGHGSVFTCQFKEVAVVTEGGPKQTVNTAKIDLNQFPPLTVLVVDNIQSNQDLIAGYFSHTHHHLLFAQDGLRGMQVAQAHRADLIFLDLLMPVMGGHETAIALKQDPTTRHIPIILITASLSYAGKTITPNSPYAGILHKPVNRQQIADGELWGGLRHLPPRRLLGRPKRWICSATLSG
ncbi:MAG: hypothetical protein DCF17_09615 [Shackletoniella antarctica]|uniref:Response regulatory domain-containing protein n=1 Tax=Shackletoniella antarctica TaxID=268115 RepID=A0A2W4Y4X0_9CYAN|nr:MAG: hypothetical protein DCF17_09615 [Shackletoniella antarctica]